MKSLVVLAALLGAMAVALISGAPALGAPPADCSILPTTALQARPCNPREECLRTIPQDARGPQREIRQQECSRLPTSGVCHGPQVYNPQSECLAQQRRR